MTEEYNHNLLCKSMAENLQKCIITETKKEIFSFPTTKLFIFNPSLCKELSTNNNITKIQYNKINYYTQYAYSIDYSKDNNLIQIKQFEN